LGKTVIRFFGSPSVRPSVEFLSKSEKGKRRQEIEKEIRDVGKKKDEGLIWPLGMKKESKFEVERNMLKSIG